MATELQQSESHPLAANPSPQAQKPLAPDSQQQPLRRFGEPFRIAGSGASSFLVHVIILCLFALLPSPDAGVRAYQEIKSWVIEDLDEPAPTENLVVNLNDVTDNPVDSLISAEALAIAPIQNLEATLDSAIETVDTADPDLEIPPIENLTAPELNDVMLQHGIAGEQVSDVEGAVDFLTQRIANHLETSDVLVVWLMDASISLVEERGAVADRLQRVYREIDELGVVREGALTGSVVAFAKDHDVLLDPSPSGDEVVAAIREIPVDESGDENVFSAIADVAYRYRHQHSYDDRHIVFVVWTDESGNDGHRLEDAVQACHAVGATVYAIGPSSMFGKQKGTQRHFVEALGREENLPVDRGPDTLRPECIRLPYWFRRDNYENIRAGVGPYHLTRITGETQGAYLINDRPEDRAPFDVALMRRYLPSYRAPAVYTKQVKQSPLRSAILQAVDATYSRELPGTPPLEFAPTGENFQQQLRRGQEVAGNTRLMVLDALRALESKRLEKLYLEEPSPRWRAWYDLTLGRLLAMKVRCIEYDVACAEMKSKGSAFVNEESNRWRFRPADEIRSGRETDATAQRARELLQRCARDHEGTPWAVLAQGELEYPLGFTVDERYVPPPPPRQNNRAGNPNIPRGRRQEQLQMLRRDRPQDLPKL